MFYQKPLYMKPNRGPPAVFVQAGIGFFSFVNSWKPKKSFVNSWKRCCSWIVKRQNIVREFVKFEIFVREFVNSYTFVSCILTKSLHKIKKLSYPHFLDLINRLTSPDGNRIQIEATPIMKQLPHNMRGLWNYHWVHSVKDSNHLLVAESSAYGLLLHADVTLALF